MLGGLFGLLHLIIWVVFAIEILKSGMGMDKKILWLIVILLLPLIGLILYFLLGRGK